MLDRLFQVRARGTTVRTEVLGGVTTFVTLSYIVFVQPAVLATTGMDPGAVLVATCLAGIAFLVLSLVGLRERLIDAIPESLKHAIAAGIGLLIALVGFEWAGIVRPVPGTIIGLGRLAAPPTLVAIAGTLLTAGLLARRAPGAIVIGTLATGLAAGLAGFVSFHGVLAPPPRTAACRVPARRWRPTPSAPSSARCSGRRP